MDKEVLKLIEESKKPFHIENQRAELLKRNEMFLKELEGRSKRLGKEFFKIKELSRENLEELSKDNILLKLDYPKVKIMQIDCPVEEAKYANILSAYYGYDSDRYDPISEIEKDSFFESRDIDTILVYDEDLDNIRTKIEFKLTVLDGYKEEWKRFCIKWHINNKWNGDLSNLSEYQYPHKERKRSNFNRDLCWYDLNKKKGYSPGGIAKLWLNYRPEDIDRLVATKIIKKYEILKGVSIADFLEEILSDDPEIKEIRDDFEEEKKIYATGQVGRAKFTPRFIDVIKKAINRMDKRIKRLNLPSPSRKKEKKIKIRVIKGKK